MFDASQPGPDSPSVPCEVLIAGGGPAAACAARLLASWGRDVVVVARPETGGGLPESLTPSCGKFFDLLGIRGDIEAAGFVPSAGHTVWWGGSARVEPFASGQHGWQATSVRLGEVMLAAARRAGARLQRAALTADEMLAWPAAWRIDATGRAGVLARPLGQRTYEPGHRTVALIGTWRASTWAVADPSHTLLESYADGWGWSVPVDDGHRAVAVMVDPRTTRLAKGQGARAVYAAEVAKMPQLSRIVAGADLVDGPSGWDASMYVAGTMTGEGWLLAGDAASFIDPLSSAGVRKAMASGWLAAVAVNTALGNPGLAATAREFYEAREHRTYADFLALTRRHLLDGAPAVEHPFWSGRASEAPMPDVDHVAVRAAFERIRAADRLALHLAPDVTIDARPALTERAIVLEERLVTPVVPDGVRYVDGIDVVALTRLATRCDDVPAWFDAYAREVAPADLHDFLKAVSTAVARGWLIGV